MTRKPCRGWTRRVAEDFTVKPFGIRLVRCFLAPVLGLEQRLGMLPNLLFNAHWLMMWRLRFDYWRGRSSKEPALRYR